MFGFLSPAVRDSNFCRAYTRLCQAQMKEYGPWLLPFHSYESTFLYLIAADAGVVSLENMPSRACCQFVNYVPPDNASALEAEKFCASFSALLGFISLKDDANDGVAIFQRLALLVFHRRFQQCLNYFSHLDPEFLNVVLRIIDGHSMLERTGGALTVQQFASATGDGFAYLFALFARAVGRSDMQTSLARIGRLIGEAICSFDMARDFFADQRSGSANPLPSEAHVPLALAEAKTALMAAAGVCEELLGERSLAAAHLLSVEKTLLLAVPNRAVKVAGRLADDVFSPCATKDGVFLSFPFVALSGKSFGEAFCVGGLIGAMGCVGCVKKTVGTCGSIGRSTVMDPETGEAKTVQEECGWRLM